MNGYDQLRVGIFGGTFAPVHNGHVAAARAFMEQMWLDVLYVIPAGIPPHKQMEGDANVWQRLRMCELAFEGMDGVLISDLEIRREGKSYTVDTLRELWGEDRRLFLLCGTDMMLTLDQWRSPEEIFKLSYPVYIRREADASLDAKIIEKIAQYHQKYGKVVRKIVTEPIELSSNEIRARLNEGKSISHLVPAAVEAYIQEKHLYV
jgi:nicotinate-nucleotide adenylyltransferase